MTTQRDWQAARGWLREASVDEIADMLRELDFSTRVKIGKCLEAAELQAKSARLLDHGSEG